MKLAKVAVKPFSVYFLIWFQAATANFKSRFERIVTLDNLVQTHDTEFNTETRSVSECAKQCFSYRYCVTFTYVTHDVIEDDVAQKRPCRGYSTAVTSQSANATPIIGAKTFSKIRKGELKDVALHKNTTQSSTYNGTYGYGGAELAVDGDSNPDFNGGRSCSVTLTSGGQTHWWQVDLASTFSVLSVTITNRGDCCAERLHDFDIHVYGEDPVANQVASGTLCHHYNGHMGAGVTEDLPCYYAPISGRFVRVSNGVTDGDDTLTLCEVQVMAVTFIE